LKNFLSAVFLLHLANPSVAQVNWQFVYWGSGNGSASDLLQTYDGGYALIGTTSSYGTGDNDIYFFKLDSIGDTLWTRTFGGLGSDYGTSVEETQDSGFIIAGFTNSFGAGGNDAFLIKTDSLGSIIWEKTYGGTGDEDWFCLKKTNDNGYIILGSTESFGAGWSDIYLIKTNFQGDTLWTRCYGRSHHDWGTDILQSNDNGYVILGTVQNGFNNGTDMYLSKIDSVGNLQWAKLIGTNDYDYGYSIQKIQSGYIVAGKALNNTTAFDINLVNVNQSGVVYWSKSFGGLSDENGENVKQTSDGGFIISGNSASFNGLYLIKTDFYGDTLWTQAYGSHTSLDNGWSVIQSNDGGYVLCGYSGSYPYGVYVVKTDSQGNSGCDQRNTATIVTNAVTLDSVVYPLTSFSNTIVTVPSFITGNGAIISPLCSSVSAQETTTFLKEIIVFPNPASAHLIISTENYNILNYYIFNVHGQNVISLIQPQTSNLKLQTFVDVTALPTGIYFVQAQTQQGIVTGKFIKQ
jgi:hypothetical protein